MSKSVSIRKGLDIKLKGEAEKVKVGVDMPEIFAVKPPDFHGLTPKMEVKVGAVVKAGDVLFHDKYNAAVKFTAPVSGEVVEVVRGEKRRILEVRIKADKEIAYKDFGSVDPDTLDGEGVKAKLLDSGLWALVRQRPVDIIADPSKAPKAIFVSCFASGPLAPDYDFILHGQDREFQAGLTALSKLTTGKVHLGVRTGAVPDNAVRNAKGVQFNYFKGKHPVGNVGVQIHHVDPINKGEYVWVMGPQDVAIIGRFFLSGKYDMSRIVALAGSEVVVPRYYKTIAGANITPMVNDNVKAGDLRYISGDALTGTTIQADGFLGFYDDLVTVLPEGNEPKFFLTEGWLAPGFKKFSSSRLFPSFLTPGKKYKLDTNLNGEERGFVVTGEMEKVLPMDIYPMQLVKAVMCNDIDLMEQLGIYEIAPEDMALCEFVCTSKIEIQKVIREGLDVVQEECL